MKITRAEFVLSVADAKSIPDYNLPEIAIAGKSNVGKSSFINFITNIGKLAKTSAEPGRTRLLNYFLINGDFHFVDLPGYGYAKVSREEKQKWASLLDGYFAGSKNLKSVLLLVDIRHKPTEDDIQMTKFLNFHNIPFTVIATKADKLSAAQRRVALKVVADTLAIGVANILPVSSTEKTGKDAVCERLDQILNN